MEENENTTEATQVGLRKQLSSMEQSFKFLKYCTLAYAEENLLFWFDVEDFKAIESKQEKLARAQALYSKYLCHGEFQINVSGEQREEIKMKISHNEVDDDLFVDVQEEVFLLLFSIYQKYLQFRKKRAQTLEISRGKDFEEILKDADDLHMAIGCDKVYEIKRICTKYSNNRKLLRSLFTNGYTSIIAFPGMSYQNAFHHAAMNHPISMKFILALDEVKRNPDLIMQKDERGWTPLHIACHVRSQENVKALLSSVLCLVSCVTDAGTLALHFFAANDWTDIEMEELYDLASRLSDKGRLINSPNNKKVLY